MGKYVIDETTLKDIADVIREKEGSTGPIPAADFATRIGAISGGGAVSTCSMRFVDDGGASYNFCYYTKCENGVISVVTMGDTFSEGQEGFDITIENVVCGSLVYFRWQPAGWGMPDAYIEGSPTADQLADLPGSAIAEGGTFIAPKEPGGSCTVFLYSF